MAQIEYALVNLSDDRYFTDAQENLAALFEIGVNACKVDGQKIADAFVASGLAHEFERMNPVFVSGKSGVELLNYLAPYAGLETPVPEPELVFPGMDYWVGWALAYFQFETGCPYRRVFEVVPYQELQGMYYPLHEAHESKFVSVLLERMADARKTTRLRIQRDIIGISQAELAERSGVGLRSIQMYEQRNKNINHASAETLYRLAHALHCSMQELIEFAG